MVDVLFLNVTFTCYLLTLMLTVLRSNILKLSCLRLSNADTPFETQKDFYTNISIYLRLCQILRVSKSFFSTTAYTVNKTRATFLLFVCKVYLFVLSVMLRLSWWHSTERFFTYTLQFLLFSIICSIIQNWDYKNEIFWAGKSFAIFPLWSTRKMVITGEKHQKTPNSGWKHIILHM